MVGGMTDGRMAREPKGLRALEAVIIGLKNILSVYVSSACLGVECRYQLTLMKLSTSFVAK